MLTFSNILDELQILKNTKFHTKLFPEVLRLLVQRLTQVFRLRPENIQRCGFLTLYDFKFVTLHQWQDWATTEDTLVFYMSGQNWKILLKINRIWD